MACLLTLCLYHKFVIVNILYFQNQIKRAQPLYPRQDKLGTMDKIKDIIKKYDILSNRQHHLISKTHKIPSTHQSSKYYTPYSHFQTSPPNISTRHHSQGHSINRKLLLPPILEFKKINPFDIESKKIDVISKLFKVKNNQKGSSSFSQRNHTEMGVIKSKEKIGTGRSSCSINLEQMRMKPVDKYFYKLDNVRLAERLLIVKPSPQLQRANHKKFFEQHNHYKFQISKNYHSPKKNKIKYKNKVKKQWVQ